MASKSYIAKLRLKNVKIFDPNKPTEDVISEIDYNISDDKLTDNVESKPLPDPVYDISDEVKIEQVEVDIGENDIPGFPKFKTYCEDCGDRILDSREVLVNGQTLCKACAEGPYYQKIG